MMPDRPTITVLIQTFNRHFFLKNALESVSLQSARSCIAEVIVSENGSSTQSREICDSFRDVLPITWIKQHKLLTPQQHALWMSTRARSDLIALIADDDIWSRYHLEEALRCFKEYPDIAAFFGQTVRVDNQACQPFDRFSGTFDQVLTTEHESVKDFKLWDQDFVAINTVASTPLNIWAVVARADAHRQALAESAGDPRLGALPTIDCLYIWRLSYHGEIAVGRQISLFYRVHADSDIQTSMRQDYQQTIDQDLEIRVEIARQAAAIGIDAVKEWLRLYKKAQEQGLNSRISIATHEVERWLFSHAPPNPKERSPKRLLLSFFKAMITRIRSL